ncbi:hypothetical protein [Clostridium sp. AF02-29]|uniref:hypothetical protein n=1 Tax=Clostridium sp. AF02-29 TaxID=2292993 RepID=UPI0023577473|nr:hypothetical protein [Clostridium sp. AF02-29]
MNGGIWHFSSCRDSRKKKFSVFRIQRAGKPFSSIILAEKKKAPYTPEFAATQSKYRPVYQISLFAHLSPGQILVGVATPNPPFAAYAAEKSPENIFSDFSKTVPIYTLFFSC